MPSEDAMIENGIQSISRKLVTSEISLFLFSMGVFINIPAMDNLILTKVCLQKPEFNLLMCENTSNKEVGKDEYVQNQLTRWELYLQICYSIPIILITLIAGSWSDKYGRWFPLLIPPVGLLIYSIMYGLFHIYIEQLPIWFLIFGNTIYGSTGGEMLMISSAMAYSVSLSMSTNHILRISIIHSMIGIPATIGPLLSLQLRNSYGSYASFFCAGGFAILSFLYSFLYLDRFSSQHDEPRTWKNLLDWNNILDSFKLLMAPRKNSKRLMIWLMLVVAGLHFFCYMAARSCIYPFIKDKPLLWNYAQYTILSSVLAGISGFSQLVVFPLMQYILRIKDMNIAVIAVLSEVIYFAGLGFSSNSFGIYLVCSLSILKNFVPVAIRTVLSKLVNENEKGKMFSIIGVVESLAFLIGSSVANSLWPLTRKIFKGLIFEICAAIVLIYLPIIFEVKHLLKRYSEESLPESDKNDYQAIEKIKIIPGAKSHDA